MTTTPTNPGQAGDLGRHMREELHSQPEIWQQVLDLATSGKLDGVPFPADGQSVAAIGCGTSWFIAQAYAAAREDAGKGVTDAYTPTEMHSDRTYDAYVIICRSGTTTEISEFLDTIPEDATSVVLTGVPDSPVARKATAFVDLGFADEESVVQTRFATSALLLLRTTVEDIEYVKKLPQQAAAALEEEIPEEVISAEQFTFLGKRFGLGLAFEAALKVRESAQAWSESYNPMEYRHGPISIAAPGRVVWSLTTPPEGLAAQIEATGATHVHHEDDPLVELVRVHKAAHLVSASRGLDADEPRNLTRSVVLDA